MTDFKVMPENTTDEMDKALRAMISVEFGVELSYGDIERIYETLKNSSPSNKLEVIAYRCRHSEQENWFFSDKPGYYEWEPIYVLWGDM